MQEGGDVFERAGAALSDVRGSKLPPSATARNPQLAGRSFRAMGVSVVMHPRNPHAPTSHANVRFFSAGDVWWFGGGFDLTPFIPYEEDVIAWHRAAREACDGVSRSIYPVARHHCDEYFFLKHRAETRGVGGIFYDDVNEDSTDMPLTWEQGFALMQRVGNAYHDAYRDIIERRRSTPYTPRERALPALPARALRGVQPRLRPRHAVRAAERWPDRVDPDVDAARRRTGPTRVRMRNSTRSCSPT